MVVNGYKLVWADEFDGDSLDENTWFRQTYVRNKTDNGKEVKQICTDSERNATVRDGKLIMTGYIEDDGSYSGCQLQTKNKMLFKYGYLEISARLAKGASSISEFWLNSAGLPFDRLPEVDVFENFGRDERIAHNLHRWWYDKDENGNMIYEAENLHHDQFALETDWRLRNSYLPDGEFFYEKFHRFGVEWTPEYMNFMLDGVCQVSVDIRGDYFKDFHQPMYVILSHCITTKRPGTETPSPAVDEVEYIRLYQREDGVIIDPTKTEITNDMGIKY